VVAAIVAGDPDGLAEAYDRYAAALYAYCSFMLPGPDDAVAVVRDTFLIATSRLERLRDPGKLRSWLHAVARNECLRRLSAAGVTARPAKTPGDGALPAVELPAALRGEVLRACADNTPAGRADRASVAHRAGTFGPAGFPKAIGSAGPPWWQWLRRHPRAAAAMATAATVTVAAVLIAAAATGSHRAQAAIVANGSVVFPGASGAPAASGAASTPARAGAASSVRPLRSPANGQPTPAVTALAGASSPGSVAGRGTPSPSASPSGTSSPASPSPSPSPSVSASPSPTRGVLVATPARLVLTSTSGKAVTGHFVLSALYGPVSNYVIEVPAAVAGKLTVSPAKGSLQAGGSVTITVSVTSKIAVDTELIVNPGDLTVTVLLSIKA